MWNIKNKNKKSKLLAVFRQIQNGNLFPFFVHVWIYIKSTMLLYIAHWLIRLANRIELNRINLPFTQISAVSLTQSRFHQLTKFYFRWRFSALNWLNTYGVQTKVPLIKKSYIPRVNNMFLFFFGKRNKTANRRSTIEESLRRWWLFNDIWIRTSKWNSIFDFQLPLWISIL